MARLPGLVDLGGEGGLATQVVVVAHAPEGVVEREAAQLLLQATDAARVDGHRGPGEGGHDPPLRLLKGSVFRNRGLHR